MSTATATTRSPLSRIMEQIPTLLAFVALGAAFWWGHHLDWSAPNQSQLAAAHAPPEEDWCVEHGVPESTCILCKKDLMKKAIAAEPKHYREKGEEIRFAHTSGPDALARSGVTTGSTVATDIEPLVEAPAQTQYEPARTASLLARLSGTVRWVGAQLGDSVDAGTMVALIEAREVGAAKSALMLALAEQQAATTSAQRITASSEAGLRTKGEQADGQARLRAAQVAVFDAEQELLNLGFSLASTELAALTPVELTTRLRALGLPRGLLASDSANLLPVIAPRAGTITELTAVVGSAVESGAPLAVVVDTAELRAELALPLADAGKIVRGQVVRFRTTDGTTANGSVIAVALSADPLTRLVAVTATLANADGGLRANQVGTAQIVLGPPAPAVVLPSTAIEWDGRIAYVFLKRTPTTFRGLVVPILARTVDGFAVGRLRAGEEVAMTGAAALKGALFYDRFGPGCECGGE